MPVMSRSARRRATPPPGALLRVPASPLVEMDLAALLAKIPAKRSVETRAMFRLRLPQTGGITVNTS